MRLKVYRPKVEVDEPPVNFLALTQHGDEICVRVVDENGMAKPGGMLVRFTRNGRLHRGLGVSQRLGFALDTQNRIVFTGDKQ